MPIDERELSKLLNPQNVGALRTIQERTGGDSVVVSLDAIQNIVLQIKDRSEQISALEAKVTGLESMINALYRSKSSIEEKFKMLEVIAESKVRQTGDIDQRIANLEARIM